MITFLNTFILSGNYVLGVKLLPETEKNMENGIEIASMMLMLKEPWNVKAEMNLRGHLVPPLSLKDAETEA